MNGTFTATIDRIVDDQTAVILLENDGEVIEQLDISVNQLPDATQEEGNVVTVGLAEGEIVSIEYEPEATQQRREAAQDRLDRLSGRLSDTD